MSALRLLVVGAGRGRSHARAIAKLPDQCELAGLVDLDQDRLGQALGSLELPDTLGHTSLEQALADVACDAVVIATWARTHEALLDQVVAAGKHVLVEKPFVSTLAQARQVLAATDARGIKLAVHQQWRYLAGQRTMRRLLRARTWGAPQVGHMVSYKARGGEYPDSPQSQLWQMTVHEVDSLISMLAEVPVAVSGHCYRPPDTTWKRESTVTGEITFRDGCRVVIVSTSDARLNAMELRVECAAGSVRYRNERTFGSAEEVAAAVPEEGAAAAAAWQTLPIEPGAGDGAAADVEVYASFARWLAGGEEPETSGRRNLQVLAVLDGLLESGRTGAQIPIATDDK